MNVKWMLNELSLKKSSSLKVTSNRKPLFAMLLPLMYK